jgi:hypothetical protein
MTDIAARGATVDLTVVEEVSEKGLIPDRDLSERV